MADADQTVFLWINGLVGRFPVFDRAMEWVVSDYLVPVGLTLTLLGLWFAGRDRATREKNQLGVITALLSMTLSNVAVFLMNNGVFSLYGGYFRPRPFADLDVALLFYQPTDSSFPANSAAAVFAIAIAVWGANRKAGAALMVAAGVFGFARVYGGVHYPLDIAGAAVIGALAAMLGLKLRTILEPLPTIAIKAARILCLA